MYIFKRSMKDKNHFYIPANVTLHYCFKIKTCTNMFLMNSGINNYLIVFPFINFPLKHKVFREIK